MSGRDEVPEASSAGPLASRLAGVARELVDVGDVDRTLGRIVDLAVETVAGCDHAGISVVAGDRIETRAQSDEVPGRIDRIQAARREGPYRDVIRGDEVHVTGDTGDLAADERWSGFSAEVVAHTGVRSMLAVRLFIADDTLGSLNLYADAVDAFGEDDDRHVAAMFATHAAVALRDAQQLETLSDATASRDVDVIGLAKGLTMAHEDVDEVTALEQLRARGRRSGRSLRQVAEDVVDGEPGG